MPHVWIVNHHASAPGESGGGQRHFELARALVAHGWTTTIIAASTDHVTGRQRLQGVTQSASEVHDGVGFRWLRVPAYRSGARRVLNMVLFWLRLIGPGATSGLPRPDVVIGSTVHPLAALAASVLAKRRDVPFVFEIRDLWPETLIDMKALERDGVIARGLRWLERLLCRRAELVITTMPHAGEYLQTQGVPPEKVLWLSNGIRLEGFLARQPPGDRHPFRFMYLGAMGRANALDTLVEGFLDAELPDAVLELVGDGPARSGLIEMVRDLGAEDRVVFSPRVPRSDVPAVAGRSHCLVAAVEDLPLYRFGISLNKLFEYMALQRPVIFVGAARSNPVELAGGGLCVTAEQASAAFRTMANTDSTTLAGYAAANRDHVASHFDYAALGGVLADRLTSLARSAPRPAGP